MSKERIVGFVTRWKLHFPILAQVIEQGATPLVLANAHLLQPEDFAPFRLTIDPIFLDYSDHPYKVADHIVDELTRRNLKPETILSIDDRATDFYLTAMELLDLVTPQFEAYRRCRIKPMTRQRLSDTGVDNTWFHMVPRTALTASQALANEAVIDMAPEPLRLAYPFVMKPATGAASTGVSIVHSAQDFLAALPDQTEFRPERHDYENAGYYVYRDVLVEEAHRGMEVEINGYVADAVIRICAFGGKFTWHDGYSIKEMGGFLVRPETPGSGPDFDTAIQTWTRDVIEALEFFDGVFHLEGFYTDERAFHMIEFNPRMGGGGTQDMVKAISGVDLVTEFVRSHLKTSTHVEPHDTGLSSLIFIWLYADRTGRIARLEHETALRIPYEDGFLEGRWRPLVGEGTLVESSDLAGELYLGRLEIHNLDRNRFNYGAVIEHAYHWLRRENMVTFESE